MFKVAHYLRMTQSEMARQALQYYLKECERQGGLIRPPIKIPEDLPVHPPED